MGFSIVLPEQLAWLTRPHDPGEPARYVAELQDLVGFELSRANFWRYEPGAKGRRHVHAEQEETFVVLAGQMTMLSRRAAHALCSSDRGRCPRACADAASNGQRGRRGARRLRLRCSSRSREPRFYRRRSRSLGQSRGSTARRSAANFRSRGSLGFADRCQIAGAPRGGDLRRGRSVRRCEAGEAVRDARAPCSGRGVS